MKKGDLVRLNVDNCFTKENGGKLLWPAINLFHDDRGEFPAWRPITPREKQEWYDSLHSVGMNDAGETKLPPTSTRIILHRDQIYTVLRARCAPYCGYRKNPGMAQVLDTESGENCYVRREQLEVVSER